MTTASSLARFIFICFSLGACAYVSSDLRPDGIVVERNKQSRPAWADAPTERLMTTGSENRFHYALLKSRDLPIAVKQSQTKAIEQSYELWKPQFDQEIGTFSQVKKLQSSARTSKELQAIIDRIARRLHSEVAQIEDIYFERIRIDSQKNPSDLEGVSEYFDVHTLVQFLPIDREILQKDLSAAFLASSVGEIKKVGRDLSPTPKRKKK
jgi:hypothetical protein